MRGGRRQPAYRSHPGWCLHTTGQRALIQQDELRVFNRLTPDFAYYSTETPVRDGKLGQAAIFRFLVRKAGRAANYAQGAPDGNHARILRDILAANDTVTRYTHNLPLHRPLPLFPFDAISECWFVTPDDAARALHDFRFAAADEDLAEVCDLGRSVTMLYSGGHWTGRADIGARRAQPIASNSSMKPDTTLRPLSQKPGSVASRPNGASSSLCRLVPPASSSAK